MRSGHINYSWIVIEHLAMVILIFYDKKSIGHCEYSVSAVFIPHAQHAIFVDVMGMLVSIIHG